MTLDVPSAVWYYVFGLLLLRLVVWWLFISSNNRLTSLISLWNLYQERSHSGLVRRFAKPLKGKLFRGFDSHPLRHQYMHEQVLVLPI